MSIDITKYQHACIVLEKEGFRLVIDPGVWTEDFDVPSNVVAVVITHEHPDHMDPEKLKAIVEANKDVHVYANADIAQMLEPAHFEVRVIEPGDRKRVGPYSLHFTGGLHAEVDPSIPRIKNTGVRVDDYLYYPGDSYALPDSPAKVVALPASAPWMKVSEAIHFLRTVQPAQVFPTHDAILSDTGKGLVDSIFGGVCEEYGGNYKRL